MPRKKPTEKVFCGARTRSGGTCQQAAGMGTTHLGAGRCKFHGGSTPVKHGIYSKIVTAEEADRFQQFEASFDMLQPSQSEIFLMFRMMEFATGKLTEGETLEQQMAAMAIGLEVLVKLSLIRTRFKQVIKGDDISIHFDTAIATDICEALAEVLCDFLPADKRAEAENRIFRLVAEKMEVRGAPECLNTEAS